MMTLRPGMFGYEPTIYMPKVFVLYITSDRRHVLS